MPWNSKAERDAYYNDPKEGAKRRKKKSEATNQRQKDKRKGVAAAHDPTKDWDHYKERYVDRKENRSRPHEQKGKKKRKKGIPNDG